MLEKLVTARELSPISTNILVNRRKSGGGYGRGNGPYKSIVCTLCRKLGHIVEVCYKKHGYPPGLRTDSINMVDADNINVDGEDKVSQESGDHKQVAIFGLEEDKVLMAILRKINVMNSVDKSVNQATISEFTKFKGKQCVSCCSINSNLWRCVVFLMAEESLHVGRRFIRESI